MSDNTRIAQLVICKVEKIKWSLTYSHSRSKRARSGFWSTGIETIELDLSDDDNDSIEANVGDNAYNDDVVDDDDDKLRSEQDLNETVVL